MSNKIPKRQNKNKNPRNANSYNSNFYPNHPNNFFFNTPYGFVDYSQSNPNFYGNYENCNFPDNFRNYQNRANLINYQSSRNFPPYNSQGNFVSYQNRRRQPGFYQNSYGNCHNFPNSYDSLQENYDDNPGEYQYSQDSQDLPESYDDFEEPEYKTFENGFVSRKCLYKKSKSPLDVYSAQNQYNEDDDQREQGPSWTDSYWKKHQGEAITSDQEDFNLNKGKKSKKVFTNKVEKTLAKMLAKPVEMSKGKSMLMKMGWDGGGLGKDGEGILEPIAPEAAYASTTMGLGIASESTQLKEERKQTKTKKQTKTIKQTKKQIKKCKSESSDDDINVDLFFKGRFKINILNSILNFVMNDFLLELKFEEKLSRGERKRIHNIVANLSGSEDGKVLSYMEEEQVAIVRSILHFNKYVLASQSDGVGAKRRLSLYKEAPPHVYFIVPEDLRDEPEEINKDEKKVINDKSVTIKATNTSIKNTNQNEANEKDKTKPENMSLNNTISTVQAQNTKKIETKSENVTEVTNNEDKTDINLHENDQSQTKNRDGNNRAIYLNKNNNQIEDNTQNPTNSSEMPNEIDNSKINVIDNSVKLNNQTDVLNVYYEKANCDQPDIKKSEDLLSLIMDYFLEFTKDGTYEEFRFLGPFNSCERQCIYDFFNLFNNDIEHKYKEVWEAMKDESSTYNVVKDDNGSLFVNKTKKEGESAASIWKKQIMGLDWVQTLSIYDECD